MMRHSYDVTFGSQSERRINFDTAANIGRRKRLREAWENDEATRRGIPRRDSHREKIKHCHRAVFQARFKYHCYLITQKF